jgi:2-phosphoglycerate kinase
MPQSKNSAVGCAARINSVPGVGKLTIARDVAKLLGIKDSILADNH